MSPTLTWLHRRAGLRVGSCGPTRRTGVCQKWAPHLLRTISLLEISAEPLHVTEGQEEEWLFPALIGSVPARLRSHYQRETPHLPHFKWVLPPRYLLPSYFTVKLISDLVTSAPHSLQTSISHSHDGHNTKQQTVRGPHTKLSVSGCFNPKKQANES